MTGVIKHPEVTAHPIATTTTFHPMAPRYHPPDAARAFTRRRRGARLRHHPEDARRARDLAVVGARRQDARARRVQLRPRAARSRDARALWSSQIPRSTRAAARAPASA